MGWSCAVLKADDVAPRKGTFRNAKISILIGRRAGKVAKC